MAIKPALTPGSAGHVSGPGSAADASPPSPRLWTRPFALLAVGQAVSRLGDGLFGTALTWIALRTGGPGAVAIVASATAAPLIAGSVVGASYADRHDRRRLMIAMDVLRLALLLGLAAALATGRVPLPELAVFGAAEGSAAAIFTPARLALVPQIVPAASLLRANGILQACFMASFWIGPLLLGPLLTVTAMPGVAAADAATFGVSAATLAALPRIPAAAAGTARLGTRADLAAGWAAVRSAPGVLLVLGTFTAALLLASGFLAVGLPAWAARAGGGPGTLGLLQGTAGVAELAGALALSRIRLRRLAPAAVAAWGVLGGFRLFLGAARSLAVGLPLMAGTGLASAATDIPLIALLQARIPARHLGKAMALWQAGIAAAVTLSPPLAAMVIGATGLTAGFAISGAALAALSCLSLLALTRRRAAATRPAPDGGPRCPTSSPS
jgi:MFS family permease